MILDDVLTLVGDEAHWLDSGSVQVFPFNRGGRPYYKLDDYRVSSAVSGPSLILVPRGEEDTDDQS
jgi:hypothetical protein